MLAACATIAAVTPSFADQSPPSQAETLAIQLFHDGRDLMNAGRYAEARAKLAESARLEPTVGTLASLAECEERLGLLVAAHAHWREALSLAKTQGDDRAGVAERELARLDAVVPRVRVVLPKGAPRDVQIRVDGLTLSAETAAGGARLDPGRRAIEVTAPGKRPWSTAVVLEANGAVVPVQVPPLEDIVAPAKPRAAPPPPPPPVTTRRPVLETIGLAGVAAGALGLGVGGFYAGLAKAKVDESNRSGCQGDECTPIGAAIRDEARSAGTVATAFLIGGGALAAGGLTLFLLSPSERPGRPAPATITARASVGPAGPSANLGGTF